MGGPKQKGVITYGKLPLTRSPPPTPLQTLTLIPLIPHRRPPTTAVSPSRQRAFKGVFHGYVFNGFSRIMRQAPYVVIPASVGESWGCGDCFFGSACLGFGWRRMGLWLRLWHSRMMGIGWSKDGRGIVWNERLRGDGGRYAKLSTPGPFEQSGLTFVSDGRKYLFDAGFASESTHRSELVLGDTGRWWRL